MRKIQVTVEFHPKQKTEDAQKFVDACAVQTQAVYDKQSDTYVFTEARSAQIFENSVKKSAAVKKVRMRDTDK